MAELQTVAVVVHGLASAASLAGEWAVHLMMRLLRIEWVAAAGHPGVQDVLVVNCPGRRQRLMLLRLS